MGKYTKDLERRLFARESRERQPHTFPARLRTRLQEHQGPRRTVRPTIGSGTFALDRENAFVSGGVRLAVMAALPAIIIHLNPGPKFIDLPPEDRMCEEPPATVAEVCEVVHSKCLSSGSDCFEFDGRLEVIPEITFVPDEPVFEIRSIASDPPQAIIRQRSE